MTTIINRTGAADTQLAVMPAESPKAENDPHIFTGARKLLRVLRQALEINDNKI